MRRRGVGFALGAVAVVTAAGLLGAQAPPPADPVRLRRPQTSAGGVRTGAAAAAAAPAAASQPPQRPSFRGGVDVVSLNVTVTDQARNFVTSLEQGDFVVFEDGVKQDVTYFNKAQLPVALSLLIDTSASMEDKLRLAQEAAIGFVRRHEAGRHRAGHRLRQPRLDPAAVHRRSSGRSRPRSGRPCRTARPRSTTRSTSRSRS